MDDVAFRLLTNIGIQLDSIAYRLERIDRRFESIVSEKYKLDRKEELVAGQASQEA